MNSRDDATDAVRACEELLLNTRVRHDREQLDRLLNDEFVEFGSSGRVYNKAEIIEALLSSSEDWHYRITGFECRFLRDDLAHVRYALDILSPDNNLLRTSLRSSLWVLGRDGWAMMFHQGTTVS